MNFWNHQAEKRTKCIGGIDADSSSSSITPKALAEIYEVSSFLYISHLKILIKNSVYISRH
jgi:hypothetical protein